MENELRLLVGASSSHSGVDIPAPPGSKLIAVHDGEITFREFLGAGGYTITLSFDNYKVSYCHCDPNWMVTVGDKIKQGQVIGCVGPKIVYGVKGNQYHDAQGNPTNGATTRSTSPFRDSYGWKICKSFKLFLKKCCKGNPKQHITYHHLRHSLDIHDSFLNILCHPLLLYLLTNQVL